MYKVGLDQNINLLDWFVCLFFFFNFDIQTFLLGNDLTVVVIQSVPTVIMGTFQTAMRQKLSSSRFETGGNETVFERHHKVNSVPFVWWKQKKQPLPKTLPLCAGIIRPFQPHQSTFS